ncbi:hypothetical protein [Mycobacterium sp.]|uniref:hypothetical protein n=1 Tax=Mycobacterium sp. TaxID=1785 RepID=UPI003F9B7672
MPMSPIPAVTLTPVAYFPEKYFLENLAVRDDGSVLITAVLQKSCGLFQAQTRTPKSDRFCCTPSST